MIQDAKDDNDDNDGKETFPFWLFFVIVVIPRPIRTTDRSGGLYFLNS